MNQRIVKSIIVLVKKYVVDKTLLVSNQVERPSLSFMVRKYIFGFEFH